MNLEQIEAFLYVSLTKSFKKAGEILYISQPTVSARIKSLEKELGCDLFIRLGKSISLTREGKTFLPFAKTSLETIQSGILTIQQNNQNIKDELSISIVLSMSHYIFPKLIRQFHNTYPKIKLAIHSGHSHNVLEMVLNHETPLGISRSVGHPKIETIHLFNDEMVIVTYPNHPFASMEKVSLSKVAREKLLLYDHGSIDWVLINNAFNKLNLKPNAVLETDNIELVKQMVKKEIGIGIIPLSSIVEERPLKDLRIIKIKDQPQLNRPYQLIYLKDTKIDGTLKIFIDFVKVNIGALLPPQ
ncbi:LysR family transcriptional regulator [Siminovitchia terrae]|uniref:LysR family transcriptional regulator n=1 Tax=Siminovitchia terrae TaxID=1914933 RepID=A0A429XCE4_SIMTE|nr:LysR family transcriptional regulator [Siminovitchia terrae]RST61090.1 LysR family transcriptional regulator [Siminovitchia terrae]